MTKIITTVYGMQNRYSAKKKIYVINIVGIYMTQAIVFTFALITIFQFNLRTVIISLCNRYSVGVIR